MPATDPPPVEPSKDAPVHLAAPESSDKESIDPDSPFQKRKMKGALDDFLESD